MIPVIDETHDPSLGSWVESASDPLTDFPLQNLPFGVFRTAHDETPRIGVAIGTSVLDLWAATHDGLLGELGAAHANSLSASVLNELMALTADARLALRRSLHALLRDSASVDRRARAAAHLTNARDVQLLMPARIGDFTDFFTSPEHARNVSAVVPGASVPASYAHLPLVYHGRTSSIVVSPASIVRPYGQRRSREGYVVGPSRRLDFEVEVGLFVGPGHRGGSPVNVDRAHGLFFGACLLNDWTARDVQALESEPLGPSQSKGFATSLSSWVVTAEALAPFRVAPVSSMEREPRPAYLDGQADRLRGALDIALEVHLSTEGIRAAGAAPARLVRTNSSRLHWTVGQLIAHQTLNGAPLHPGDLMATGTVSGDTPETGGSLLELSRAGRVPIALSAHDPRTFLEDGDEVIVTASCTSGNASRIGFGECLGRIKPARDF